MFDAITLYYRYDLNMSVENEDFNSWVCLGEGDGGVSYGEPPEDERDCGSEHGCGKGDGQASGYGDGHGSGLGSGYMAADELDDGILQSIFNYHV